TRNDVRDPSRSQQATVRFLPPGTGGRSRRVRVESLPRHWPMNRIRAFSGPALPDQIHAISRPVKSVVSRCPQKEEVMAQQPRPSAEAASEREVATLGGGCFWCLAAGET